MDYDLNGSSEYKSALDRVFTYESAFNDISKVNSSSKSCELSNEAKIINCLILFNFFNKNDFKPDYDVKRISESKISVTSKESVSSLVQFDPDKTIGVMISEIVDIYKNDFRHQYHIIAQYISKLFASGSLNSDDVDELAAAGCANFLYCLDIIAEWKTINEKKYFAKCKAKVLKIYDHLKLELHRALIIKRQEEASNELLKEIEEIRNTASALQKEIEETTNTASSLKKDLESAIEKSQKIESSIRKFEKTDINFITTLGIFTGIVMAFSGVFSFSSSIFNNFESVSIIKLLIVIWGMAWFLGMVIYILIYAISKLTDRNVFSKCYRSGQSECKECKANKDNIKCNVVMAIKNKHRLLLFLNVIFTLGLIILLYINHSNS